MCKDFRSKCSLSWSAVIAGALVTVGFGFLLHLYFIAIGISILKSTTTAGASTFAIGGFLGLLLGIIVTLFIAGWVAGYIGRGRCFYKKNLGILYGFLAWSLGLILTVILASHVENFITSTSNFVTHSSSTYSAVIKNNPQVAANVMEVATTDADKNTYALFFLFFIGALASCFGGYCGYCCKKSHCEEEKPRTTSYPPTTL